MIKQLKKAITSKEQLKYLIKSDFKIRYRNKTIGFLWTVFDPLLMMLVYIILVVVLFKRGGPQFPVLLFSALLSWKWFSFSMGASVNSIREKGTIIQTIHFPKIILPLSKVALGLIDYAFGVIVIVPMLFIFKANFSVYLFWFPILVVIQFILTIGICLYVSVIGTYFRDLSNIIQFLVRIWFFLSPGLYQIDRIPERFLPIYMLNPFAALFNSYKNILIRGLPPNKYIIIASLLALLLFVTSLIIFEKYEDTLVKEL